MPQSDYGLPRTAITPKFDGTKRFVVSICTSTPQLDSGDRSYVVEHQIFLTSDNKEWLLAWWEQFRPYVNSWFGYDLSDQETGEAWALHTGEWESYED